MAQTYQKKERRSNTFYTIITIILLSALFLSVVNYFYSKSEEEAYDQLHSQTKHIKDDLELQLISDRENLITMANFAAKLYSDGESYNIMFNSFEPIGLIANIGILTPDNTFVTKVGSIDLSGAISFTDEIKKGTYISGRVKDLTTNEVDIIRSAVPIKVNEETVGILYGVIKLDTINKRYGDMAKELNADLFVYDSKSGNFVVDTVHSYPQNISFLKDYTFNDDYSYDLLVATDCGYVTFESEQTKDNLYAHYSPLERIPTWQIMLVRGESYVFAEARNIIKNVLIWLFFMVLIMFLYLIFVVSSEKANSDITKYASNIRKLLLELNQNTNNINGALKNVLAFAKSRSAIYVDIDGTDYNYILPAFTNKILSGEDRKYFISQLFRYASKIHESNKTSVNVMCIKSDAHLKEINPKFFDFITKHEINEISLATVINENNHISILGVINPKRSHAARILLEDIVVCFSIAVYNKKHLDKTENAVTTDALTGISNRVSYNRDISLFDRTKPENFCCIYIDVNGLHLINNKSGHAAGDEMLIYVANTLKDVFFEHKIYRMGGDEFLVFAEKANYDAIKKRINLFVEQLNKKNYYVSIGISFRAQNIDTKDVVREAEVRMYDAKAKFYQSKDQESVSNSEGTEYVQTKTGISEIDTILYMLKDHYNGIYRVSLDTDKARRILMPTYLGYNETEDHFSDIFTKYVEQFVSPDSHRAMLSFLNYETLKQQLADGSTPRLTYKKINDETVVMTIYRLGSEDEPVNNVLWVFSKA